MQVYAFAKENSGIPTGAHPSIRFVTITNPDASRIFTVMGAKPLDLHASITPEEILSAI
jgi:hypothetical protein